MCNASIALSYRIKFHQCSFIQEHAATAYRDDVADIAISTVDKPEVLPHKNLTMLPSDGHSKIGSDCTADIFG